MGALADFVLGRVGDGHRHADGDARGEEQSGRAVAGLIVRGFGIQGPAVSGSLQPECRK